MNEDFIILTLLTVCSCRMWAPIISVVFGGFSFGNWMLGRLLQIIGIIRQSLQNLKVTAWGTIRRECTRMQQI